MNGLSTTDRLLLRAAADGGLVYDVNGRLEFSIAGTDVDYACYVRLWELVDDGYLSVDVSADRCLVELTDDGRKALS